MAAVPFGWDLSRITRLCLQIDLGDATHHNACMKALNFDVLRNMRKLTMLRVAIAVWDHHPWRVHLAPNLVGESVDENGVPRRGTPDFKAMVKRLQGAMPESVRQLEFGLPFGPGAAGVEDWRWGKTVLQGDSLRTVFEDV